MQNILITGGDHEDRIKHATRLAQRLLCINPSMNNACGSCVNCERVFHHTHPNLIIIEPVSTATTKDDNAKSGSGVIKIDQIREIVVENNKANFEPGASIVVITHMHKTTKSAANALLKVMEESKRQKIIVALAPSRTSVLPTIASRLVCQPVVPNLAGFKESNADRERRILAISRSRLSARFSFCETFSTERELLVNELEELSHECHVMLRQGNASRLFILKLREALEHAVLSLKINLNPRLVTERLVLREWPTQNR